MKDKNHKTISVDAEKMFDKIQHSSIFYLSKTGYRRNISQYNINRILEAHS